MLQLKEVHGRVMNSTSGAYQSLNNILQQVIEKVKSAQTTSELEPESGSNQEPKESVSENKSE